MAMNPGVSAAGQAAFAAAAGVPGRAAIGGMSAPSFDVDTSGLDQTSKKIQQIVTDIGKLDAAVNKLAKSLDSMASKATGAFGGGQQGGGRSGGLTTAQVSGGTFGGPAGQVLGLSAAGEVMAKAAGGINNIMGSVISGGGGADLVARQTAATFSGSTSGNLTAANVSALNKIRNLNPMDLNKAAAQLQNNPFLYNSLQAGTKNNKRLRGFMNTLTGLNPSMGAAGAADVANNLASGPALQAMQLRIGNGKGLINTRGGINSTGEIFSSLLATLTGGQSQNWTPADLKKFAKNSGAWGAISQNNTGGVGLNLPGAMITELRAYAGQGGSVPNALKAMANSPNVSNMTKSTSKTRLIDTTYQHSIDGQNVINTGEAKVMDAANWFVGHGGPLASIAFAFGAITKAAFGVGKGLTGLDVLLTEFGLKGGAGGVRGPVSSGGVALEGAGASVLGKGLAGKLGAVGAAYAEYQFLKNPRKTLTEKGPDPLHIGSLHIRSKVASALGWNSKEGIGSNLADNLNPMNWGDPLPGMGDPTGSTSTQGMTPRMARSISAMRAANPNIRISSGHRTSQQQATLYALKGGRGVARPGQSNHQTGRAADLGPPSQFGWIAKNASKFGLARPAPSSEPWHVESMGDPATGASVVAGATSFLGTSYSWGGGNAAGPTLGIQQGAGTVGLDCSGLVVAVYGKLGISLPRTSQQQAKAGKAVSSLAQAQPGDLILYNEPGEGPNSHVAIYIGGGRQIAAPHTGTVVQVQPVDKAHLSCIRRIVGGGAGHGVVQAAQGMVGRPSNDASNHSGGVNVGLQNTFIAQVNAGGAGLAGLGGGGGKTSGSNASTGVSAGGGSSAASPGRMSAQQVYNLAMGAGLSKRAAQIATAVADVESRFDPSAIDHDSNGSTDYGLWQINSIHGVGTNMFSPSAAAQKMAQMTNKGTNWGPWAPDFGSKSYGGNPQIGGKVESAMKSLGYMGDPVAAMGTSMGGMMAPVSGGGGGGSNRPINVYLTNQMISMSASDAQQLVQMVIAAIKDEGGLAAVSGS